MPNRQRRHDLRVGVAHVHDDDGALATAAASAALVTARVQLRTAASGTVVDVQSRSQSPQALVATLLLLQSLPPTDQLRR